MDPRGSQKVSCSMSDLMVDLWNLIYSIIIYPIIYILPAYVANGAPVIFGGGMPLDMNRKFLGKPIFGKHKTLRGLITGIASGFIIAFLLSFALSYMLLIGIVTSIGTHVGDLLGSFIKRRLNRKEGTGFAFFDQYLFLIFAILLAIPLDHLPSVYGIIFLFILTGLLHRSTNKMAHKAKLKEVPW